MRWLVSLIAAIDGAMLPTLSTPRLKIQPISAVHAPLLACVRCSAAARIQASYIPDNVRSGRLLQRLGFQREGLAPRYLFIDGAWRDHVITALINPHFDDGVFKRSATG